jgi:hypothetical protein
MCSRPRRVDGRTRHEFASQFVDASSTGGILLGQGRRLPTARTSTWSGRLFRLWRCRFRLLLNQGLAQRSQPVRSHALGLHGRSGNRQSQAPGCQGLRIRSLLRQRISTGNITRRSGEWLRVGIGHGGSRNCSRRGRRGRGIRRSSGQPRRNHHGLCVSARIRRNRRRWRLAGLHLQTLETGLRHRRSLALAMGGAELRCRHGFGRGLGLCFVERPAAHRLRRRIGAKVDQSGCGAGRCAFRA